jgi:hypothetical protein
VTIETIGRAVVLVGLLAAVACGCGKINAGASPQGLVTTTPASTTTTTTSSSGITTIPTSTKLPAVIPGACPPGCSLPSDHDAITVLASSAEQVAIVTMRNVVMSTGIERTAVVSEQTLEGNVVGQYPPTPLSDGSILVFGNTYTIQVGQTYLLFESYNRGGPCMSALFSYDAATQMATLAESDDGPESPVIHLPGRVVTIPHTISLADVQERMYPTGGVVDPVDTEEEACPGP